MTITVLAILETDFKPDPSLAKIMNEKLKTAASDMQNIYLLPLENVGQRSDDLVVYLSYNPKYKIRWRVANDVSREVEAFVSSVCGNQGFIHWKTAVLNVFKGNE